ncbi:MAG: AAA family ATPase, partial [candidate division Zixibacteria bacterium]|nr:AAA family ATPase [candidate division Zixibacteria bacterium]
AHGRRTLLIDLDPQGHSGLGLGLDIESLENSVYDVVVKGKCLIRRAIVRLRPNLEILPSNIDLAAAELEMARLQNKEARLKELIDELRDRYEYVVIDCS